MITAYEETGASRMVTFVFRVGSDNMSQSSKPYVSDRGISASTLRVISSWKNLYRVVIFFTDTDAAT